ncbi:hypothetical protein B1C78_17265 [Thioalkalivibrio denitrificans]|uniref:Cyclic di-GMP receptor atypical PilZ domain-containing protein n=1 Tax=Thioalkalivibrio denitrificans TaxID=108003 RepID=A0A1V3N655_9GAMM|nr:PilZ domain-containing protein [Thioalkalivibrio denitrificans]OOG20524.1 hypothetical protein B1C78_17265 [Thioalkalivibrio denitrificans]
MSSDPFEEGLVCEEELPLAWSVVEALPADPQMAALHVSNEALIRACESLEEVHRPVDDSSEVAHELVRIESKLNVVVELLGEWLRRQGDTPPSYTVRFNASAMEWNAPDGPPVGSLVHIRLHLCNAFPKALNLYGEVVDSTQGPEAMQTLVKLRNLSQSVADGLERTVFRRHRRAVAQSRGRVE